MQEAGRRFFAGAASGSIAFHKAAGTTNRSGYAIAAADFSSLTFLRRLGGLRQKRPREPLRACCAPSRRPLRFCSARRHSHETRGEPVASANAGRASCLQSNITGPAWLRWSFGVAMNQTLIISLVVVAAALCAFAAGGLYLLIRDTRRRAGVWGINRKPVFCPRCHSRMPHFRVPTSWHQGMWGGWICKSCGCEMDKWGAEMPSSRASSV